MCDMALATAHAALIGHKGEGENGETNCDRWQDVGQYQRLRFLTGRPAPVQSQSLARYHGGDSERVPGGARAHSPEQASAHIADRPPGLTGFPQFETYELLRMPSASCTSPVALLRCCRVLSSSSSGISLPSVTSSTLAASSRSVTRCSCSSFMPQS